MEEKHTIIGISGRDGLFTLRSGAHWHSHDVIFSDNVILQVHHHTLAQHFEVVRTFAKNSISEERFAFQRCELTIE